MSEQERGEIKRQYEVKGISAHPDWWAEVDEAANEMGLGRSGLIRFAVNDFLKDGRVDTPQTTTLAAT